MSTAPSSDTAGASQSQVQPCTVAHNQEEPATGAGSSPSRTLRPMAHLLSQLRVSAWAETLCKALSSLKKIKAGFWSHVLVAVPLLIAILTLWPTFAGTADTKKATELAKWTAKKDFIEFCQSFNWEPAGCDLQPDSLGPPPVFGRQVPHPSDTSTDAKAAFSPITLVVISLGVLCLLVKFQQRRMQSLLQGSFHRLSRYRYSRRAAFAPLLSVFEVSDTDTDQTLQSDSVAHSTGLEAPDHIPRRRQVGSGIKRRAQSPPLGTYDRTEDDNDIKLQPERHVDYFSHAWQEQDLHQSWRHVQSQKTNYENAARLENAAWRTWTKYRHNLPTISQNHINWLKDYDVTWLYGPLQPQSVELYGLRNYSEENKRRRKREMEITRRIATSNVEKNDQYGPLSFQLGLDETVTKGSHRSVRRGGNLKHGRHLDKRFARDLFIRSEPKEVRFKDEI